MQTATCISQAKTRAHNTLQSSICRTFFLCLFLFLLPGQALCGEVLSIDAAQAEAMLNKKAPLVIIDIRTPREFASGHIPRAVNIDFNSPRFDTNLRLFAENHDPETPWLLYCRTGNRSTAALPTIQTYFSGRIYHLDKGIVLWPGPLESD